MAGAGPESETVTATPVARARVFTPTSVTVAEGGSDVYTVKLTSEPSDTVTVTVASNSTSTATVLPTSLSFSTSDWDTAQPVSVSGMEDTAVNPGGAGLRTSARMRRAATTTTSPGRWE